MSPEPENILEMQPNVDNEMANKKMQETKVLHEQKFENVQLEHVAHDAAASANLTLSSFADTVLCTKQQCRGVQHTLQQCDALFDAASPSSSISASTADATFEPTIDMMVNDFDDEQTLNEEEALAALESHDPDDEIATLKEESEMPIHDLLAKYGSMTTTMPVVRYAKKRTKQPTSGSRKRVNHESAKTKTHDKIDQMSTTIESNTSSIEEKQCDVIVIESGDEDVDEMAGCDDTITSQREMLEYQQATSDSTGTEHCQILSNVCEIEKELKQNDNFMHPDVPKKRRSHLLDLYPEENFHVEALRGEDTRLGAKKNGETQKNENTNSTLDDCDERDEEEGEGEGDDDDEDDDEDDDVETNSDYVRKIIMVGLEYQASIPGMQQYGDILPYENEDKLIWEPSQVSENEVEEYLLKARDMKLSGENGGEKNDEDDDESTATSTTSTTTTATGKISKNSSNADLNIISSSTSTSALASTSYRSTIDIDNVGLVKDNEQALHLLVQCGYDFKEALRRRRLNAAPLTGTMSLWSEDECSKFEEGILKFGKDFYKIRQNQVRTRTMRELVQFYYLWKKSERRDHDFANSNTVDHMDIYLNEGEDFGSTTTSTTTAAVATTNNTNATNQPIITTSNASLSRKSSQNNFSILTGSSCSNSSNNTNNNNSIFGTASTVDGSSSSNSGVENVINSNSLIVTSSGVKMNGSTCDGGRRRNSSTNGNPNDGHLSNILHNSTDGSI